MSKNTKTLLIIAVVLLMVCFGALIVLLLNGNSNSPYEKQIKQAAAYYEKGDYEQAIVKYEEILKKDSKNTEAYKGAARSYMKQSKYDKAMDYLRKGYDETGDPELKSMLEDCLARMNVSGGDTQLHDLSEVIDASDNVVVYGDMLSVISTYTYGDYLSLYTVSDSSTATEKHLNEIPIVLYFDAEPNEASKPSWVSIDDMLYLFNGFSKGVSYERLQSLALDGLDVVYNEELSCNTVVFTLNGCTVYVESDESGNIVKENPLNRILTYLQATSTESKPAETSAADDSSTVDEADLRTFSGYVKSSSTNASAGIVRMEIYEGKQIDKGELYTETYTNTGGDFEIELPYGEYNVEISGDGYITETFDFEVSEKDKTTEQDFFISPQIGSGVIRIVLTWGASPRDIDSHLEGTSSAGSNVSVWYGNKTVSDSSGNVIATLDIDEINGYGVETTTIYDTNGSYTYYVNQFSSDGSIIGSDAQIKIYEGDSSTPQIVNLPDSNDTGDRTPDWYVLSIQNGKVSIINEYKAYGSYDY